MSSQIPNVLLDNTDTKFIQCAKPLLKKFTKYTSISVLIVITIIAACFSKLALSALGKYDEAVMQYDYALELNPSDTTAMYNKGFALDELGKYEEAINYYDAVLSIEPDNENATQSTRDASTRLRNQ